MPRGRKKDLTIPANRTLTLQRDYRARKAQYIAGLEARCAAAEAENQRLRQEIALLRAQNVPLAGLSPEAIQASIQLRDALAAASASLAYFTDVAVLAPAEGLASPASTAGVQQPQRPSVDSCALNSAFSMDCGPARPESPCCGGFIDCEGLVEEDDNIIVSVSQILPTSAVR